MAYQVMDSHLTSKVLNDQQDLYLQNGVMEFLNIMMPDRLI
ncbi:hypothetical protein [uncultured Enterococcus sp.]|nr:hypothetical protein [uncultured Enterococcus sp.]